MSPIVRSNLNITGSISSVEILDNLGGSAANNVGVLKKDVHVRFMIELRKQFFPSSSW